MKTCFHSHFVCKFSSICNFAIFVWIFMKFLPKYRTKKSGMIYTVLVKFFAHSLIGKGPIFSPKSGLGNSLVLHTTVTLYTYTNCSKILNTFLFLISNKKLVFRTGIHKLLVRISIKEDSEQTLSLDRSFHFDIQLYIIQPS